MIKIIPNVSLLSYNTFHFDAKAKYFLHLKKIQEIKELLSHPLWWSCPVLFLWAGANLLFTKHYPWLVIKVSIMWKEIIKQNKKEVYVKVWAGENWDAFVRYCVRNNWWWVENLIRIPWTVWAAPVWNIWAYWKEAKDCIYQVIWVDLRTGKSRTLSNKQCQFDYRSSIFKHELKDNFIVTHVVFALKKVDSSYVFSTNYADVQQVLGGKKTISLSLLARTISSIRKHKLPDPKEIWTAWSFFKNPVISSSAYATLLKKYPTLKSYPVDANHVKLAAGQLIEMIWYKWKKIGHVWIHPQHALILVHYGNGDGKEIVWLAETIQKKVYSSFGVHLHPEVIYV